MGGRGSIPPGPLEKSKEVLPELFLQKRKGGEEGKEWQ